MQEQGSLLEGVETESQSHRMRVGGGEMEVDIVGGDSVLLAPTGGMDAIVDILVTMGAIVDAYDTLQLFAREDGAGGDISLATEPALFVLGTRECQMSQPELVATNGGGTLVVQLFMTRSVQLHLCLQG